MYYYFCSEYLSAIKLNGIYYGTLTDAIKSLRIDDCYPLIEVCPLVAGENTVNFILDQSFLSCPVKNVSVTDLKGGYLIKFIKNNLCGEFKIISQNKFNDCAVTVFNENGVKISVETNDDFFADNFNRSVTDAKISRFTINQTNFIAVLLIGEQNVLSVYSISGKIQKVMLKVVDDFTADNSLKTTESFNDVAKHTVTTEWGYENGNLMVKDVKFITKDGFSPQTLNENIVPYAFAESFLLNAEWKEYLCGSVLENCAKLKGFLGEFIGVLPPPTFRNYKEVGLLYKLKENLYEVKYFTFTLDGNKICGVQKCD